MQGQGGLISGEDLGKGHPATGQAPVGHKGHQGRGSPLPPEISLDLTGKKPGRGAYLCLDAQCLKQARKSRRLERAFSCKIPEEVYQRLEEEIAQAERAAQEAQQPAGPLDEKGQPIIVIEEPEEPLPRRKEGGHG